jgi:hypothetical protein
MKYKVGEIRLVEMYQGQKATRYNLVKILSINPVTYMYLSNQYTYIKKPHTPKLRKLTNVEKIEFL